MRAVSCKDGQLAVVERPAPRPGKGQVLIDVTRCGICGSDLHAREHPDELADVMAQAGYDGFMRAHHDVVFGHEFAGTVAEYGPGCAERVPGGAPVVALPLRRSDGALHAIGLSAMAPGGYAEQTVVEESLMFPVPNGLPADMQALTEPMAIGWHAVRRGELTRRTTAIVIGCGPIGLAVICMLKAQGVEHVIASDLSPGRRALASACGASVVVDPLVDSPYASASEHGHLVSVPAAAELALGSMQKLRRARLPWQHVWRALDKAGVKPKAPVIFECVGVPGILDAIITQAPLYARVVVVGVCVRPDTIRPAMAVNKEIEMRFVVGYTPLEFYDTLHMLARGKVNAAPLLTSTVGLDGVQAAFDALAGSERQAKILIDPHGP